jgi:hypothetical protein
VVRQGPTLADGGVRGKDARTLGPAHQRGRCQGDWSGEIEKANATRRSGPKEPNGGFDADLLK